LTDLKIIVSDVALKEDKRVLRTEHFYLKSLNWRLPTCH